MTERQPLTPNSDAPAAAGVLQVSHDEMRSALASGLAQPLARYITDIVTYRGRWWITYTTGWLAVTDLDLLNKLDNYQVRRDLQVLATDEA
jgi:hypothetical protein